MNAYGTLMQQRGKEMRDTLKELDRPGGVIPVTPEAVGDLINEVRRLRDSARNPSIRCPECIAANEPDPRFAPPRKYSPESDLSSAIRSNATELLVLYGQMIANGSRDMVRQFYAADLRTRINALYDALDRYEATK